MPKCTPKPSSPQAPLSTRIRTFVARGALLLVVGVPAYFGAASFASAHSSTTTITPSYMVAPLDPTPQVSCGGTPFPC